MKNLYEKFIIWGYIKYGMMYGDSVSYSFLGDCGDPGKARYKWFRDRYQNLGYKIVPFDEFVVAGGYRGRKHLTKFLMIKE